MLKHIWTVLCRKSIIDSETNNISLNDVLEQLIIDIKVSKEDAKKISTINIPIEFEIVSMWLKEESKESLKANLNVDFVNPQGKILKKFDQMFEMPVDMRRMRTRIKILGMNLETSGDYLLRISIKEGNEESYRVMSEIPLEVHLNKQIIDSKPN